MSNPKVSIIVPIYNKEKELTTCLKSIVNQTYNNLEIILINDGSKDKSLEICENFSKYDNRIIIIDKENEGLEKTRLLGVKTCTSNYLMFVDSDDYLSLDAVEVLMNGMQVNNSDVCCGGFQRVIGKLPLGKKKCSDSSYNISIKDFIDFHLKSFCGWGDFPVTVWAKLYKKELWNDVVLSNVSYGEDLCFNLQVLTKASKITMLPNMIYYYRWGGMTTFVSPTVIEDALRQYKFKCEYFDKYDKNECIEMANVELSNYVYGYLESLICHKYSFEYIEIKMLDLLNDDIVVNACNNVSYDWYNNSLKYTYLKHKNIKKMYKYQYKSNKKRRFLKSVLK